MFEVHFVYTVYKTTKIQVQNNLLPVMSMNETQDIYVVFSGFSGFLHQ
jgi:hypothetical protein